MKQQKIIIVGAGRHGTEVHCYIFDMIKRKQSLDCIGFIDEIRPPGIWNSTKILGNIDYLKHFLSEKNQEQYYYITAIGNSQIRQVIVNKIIDLRATNLQPWTLVYPSNFVGTNVVIGQGTCIAPGCICTTHIQIGIHCIINIKVSISHNCVIGDYVTISPGVTIAGDVDIGSRCFIGAGATIIDKIKIGNNSIIGAGAVVTTDIPSNVTAVGVPARIIKRF